MSRSYNGWTGEPTRPPGLTQTDRDQQSVPLPFPSSSIHGTPSDPERPYYAHQPPVTSRPVPPAVSYSQPLNQTRHHNSEHGANHHPRTLHSSHPPFHYPPPNSRDLRFNEVWQEHPQPVPPPVPQPMRYGQQRAHPMSTQHPQSQWQSPTHPTVGLGQPETRSGAPPFPAPEHRTRASGIPNLVGDDKAQAVQSMKFRLAMRQQPKAARACGSGERDRRNIDPPPIVQLHIEAPGLAKHEIDRYLRYEGYVVNCGIYDETGAHDASHMPSEYRYQRRLTGSLVGTPFYGKDEGGQEGCFFPFSDLSVRTLGKYRLKFNLIMLDTTRPGQHIHFPILAEVFSDVFDVYTAKEFPGINESSKLVRRLREQGCIISIKKGNDKKKRIKDFEEPSDDEDNLNDDDDGIIQNKRMRES